MYFMKTIWLNLSPFDLSLECCCGVALRNNCFFLDGSRESTIISKFKVIFKG